MLASCHMPDRAPWCSLVYWRVSAMEVLVKVVVRLSIAVGLKCFGFANLAPLN